jgi:hypothetical protein
MERKMNSVIAAIVLLFSLLCIGAAAVYGAWWHYGTALACGFLAYVIRYQEQEQ